MQARLPVGIDDVQAAREALRGAIERTPCLHSRTLSRLFGCTVWLKFENLQFTASFKERGALNKLLSLSDEERRRGVIAMSAGNHAQGVAYHAGRLGIPATIVMPAFTPFVKVRNTEALGARVVLAGQTLAEASAHAKRLAEEHGYVFVHPYDDALVIAGQGTVALEMLEANPALEVLVVPVGGGGLIAGCAVAAKSIRPGIEVIGVESSTYPAMAQLLAGKPVQVGTETLAEGLAVRDIGALPLAIARALVDQMLLVEEATIEQAIALLIEIEKTVTEGAGATGIAALLQHPERFAGREVGVVLCGGNIDSRILATILMRNLVREGRLIRLRARVPDVAGSLARLAKVVGDAGGNILDVEHQRMFGVFSVKSTEIELTVETRDRAHVAVLLEALAQAGFAAELLSHASAS
ncbi:MAG: threonine ammonia-lyase [Casimicrobiaceae bacterium]|nr:threonine ammonia-lyase [Casimicrobiaceae bacterium]MCX8098129.1 threonine ammonia-lyase [Casimicrobiaceae bacterium]MDW8311667.1 threonine ammonia-lyase [Burkholderiales bacterium]